MSMTLEEAIEQVERTYKESRGAWLYALKRGETKYAERCKKNMDEFGQLAEWLKELQERRKQPEIIRCKDCKHKGTKNCVANAWATIYGFGVKDNFYCGLAERRTDDKTDKGPSC